MTKLHTEELAKRMKQATLEASQLYCEHNNLDSIDKQYWIFLHLGFMAALRLNGYTDKEVSAVQERACELLDFEHGKTSKTKV